MRLQLSILGAAACASAIALFATVPGTAIAQATAAPSPSASAPTAASSAPAATATVDTKEFVYTPGTLTVAVGTKVTFKNSDSVAHTVTAVDKSFDSGNMDQNATWSHVFAKAGTYDYVCAYHAFMKGKIVVK